VGECAKYFAILKPTAVFLLVLFEIDVAIEKVLGFMVKQTGDSTEHC